MLVDAKLVKADPEHPLAVYEAGQELEGPAAELQVALGHARALPEPAAVAEEAAPEDPASPAEPTLEVEGSQATEAPAAARAEDGA